MRSGHVPQTGDVYVYCSSGHENIIRLGARKTDGPHVSFEKESYSFLDKAWVPEKCRVSESELKQYYRLCLIPVEELLSTAEKVFNGEPLEGGAAETDTAELVLHGSELPSLLSSTELLEDRMTTLSIALKARMREEEELMRRKMEPLNALIKATQRQLEKIHQAISIVEIYQGVNVEIVSLCEGRPAAADVPVSIRQRILFMDEECAVLDEEGQGLDYWTRDRFYEWIKEPRHRDVILPEQKCVVVMKPRRFDRQYAADFYTQSLINQWNRHSFVFIRNGENVSVIESEDLCIHGAVVPRKADYENIEKEARTWRETAEKEMDDINYRCIHFAMVLQGVNDRTEIFSPHGEVNFLRNIGSEIIFDDEQDSLIGTGLPDFPKWLKEQSSTIRRGSRIIFIAGYSGGEPFRYDLRGYSRNHPHYRGPSGPETGLYTVEEKPSYGLGFTYLPKDEIWSPELGYHKRTRRETWLFDKTKVINFDTVSFEVLKSFLDDRNQRKYYQGIIPTLKKFETELRKEREYENLFVSALSRVLDDKGIGHTPESLQEALKWWKNKVIHIRPVSSDDDKAWRMIVSHVKYKTGPNLKNKYRIVR